jgi:ribonucleoside-diphosphate reductase alpha chain
LLPLLIELGISYDSDDAVWLAERVMQFIGARAFTASRRLAEERGVFPAWQGSPVARTGTKVRNATCTTIAPTGTIGIIAGTSASIEPLFALAYRRTQVLGERELLEVNPLLEERLERLGCRLRTSSRRCWLAAFFAMCATFRSRSHACS